MLAAVVKNARANSGYDFADMQTMGDRIRLLRESHNLSQEGLARQCGVSRASVSQWETGATANIKLATFMKLCAALHTDPQYLIWGYDRAPGGIAPSTPGKMKRG